MNQNGHHFHFAPFAKVSSRPKSNRRLLTAPYQIRNAEQISAEQQRILSAHEMVGPSRKWSFSDGDSFFNFEGPMEVAVEIEVKETAEAEGTDTANGTENSANLKPQMAQEKPQGQQRESGHLEYVPSPSLEVDELRPLPPFRHSFRPKSAPSAVGSIRHLLRFDPTQCFDIEEFRVRMAAAQQKIEALCSLNLDNVKIKQENGQLRQKLGSCEHRIGLLEASVLERNERLKELLKENVFIRAQFKKVQNEFGIQAVNEVFNRKG